MGDEKSVKMKTLGTWSSEEIERKMILLKIAENEKSQFEDVITGAESDNGWEDCWKETENSVTQSVDDVETIRSVPEEWMDVHSTVEAVTEKSPDPPPTGPHSYYELMDLNREPVDSTVRLARVPSQYQLDALSEMFIFDVPQNYSMRREVNCQPVSSNAVVMADQDEQMPNDWSTPYFVNSEYVSELLM